MQRIFSSFLAFFTLIFAVFGLYDVKDAGEFNNTDWMSEINGSSYISEISIPGTHDSGALYEPIVPLAKCQSYTIQDQLEMGVRFLDVRVFMLFGNAQISHGVILQGQSFREVVDVCLKFLEENPSETIVFSLKNEGTVFSENDPSDVIKDLIAEDEAKWYTENRIPTLDEVRGKIVLLNRVELGESIGIPAAKEYGWEKNKSFEIAGENCSIHVQDYYSLGEADNIEAMWEEAMALFDECQADSDKATDLYINFLSGYTGSIPNITEVSAVANEKLLEFVNNTEKACCGIVVMDFVNEELCEKIIETNF